MAVRSCAAKGLDFSLALDPEVLDTLLGDASRLTQALLSLVNNAIQIILNDTGLGLYEALPNEVRVGFASDFSQGRV